MSCLLLQSLLNAGDSSVCVVHTTADGVVLAALADGQVMIFKTTNKTRSFFKPDKTCLECTRDNSEIVAMQSVDTPKLLVIGFACGKAYIYSYQDSIQEAPIPHYCSHLSTGLSLHSLLCFCMPSGPCTDIKDGVLEVWYGTSSSLVVIKECSLSPNLHSKTHHHTQVVRAVPVCTAEHASTSKEYTAKELRMSADMSYVVALLHQKGSQVSSLALINTESKTLFHHITCNDSSGM